MAKGTLALRQIQLGDNADTSKNFVISVPAVADGTLTIERENGTDVLTIDANGRVAFPYGESRTVSSSATNTVTNKVQVSINGVTYYLLASTSGA